jgi:hypothetical protein
MSSNGLYWADDDDNDSGAIFTEVEVGKMTSPNIIFLTN